MAVTQVFLGLCLSRGCRGFIRSSPYSCSTCSTKPACTSCLADPVGNIPTRLRAKGQSVGTLGVWFSTYLSNQFLRSIDEPFRKILRVGGPGILDIRSSVRIDFHFWLGDGSRNEAAEPGRDRRVVGTSRNGEIPRSISPRAPGNLNPITCCLRGNLPPALFPALAKVSGQWQDGGLTSVTDDGWPMM